MKLLVILFLVLIITSLGSALLFLVKDRGNGNRTVKALALRVGLSIALFLMLMIGYATGVITTRL